MLTPLFGLIFVGAVFVVLCGMVWQDWKTQKSLRAACRSSYDPEIWESPIVRSKVLPTPQTYGPLP